MNSVHLLQKTKKWAETCVAGGGVQKARFFEF